MEISASQWHREHEDPSPDMADHDSPDETFNLRELIGKFWARKTLIVSCVIVCALLSLIVAKRTKPVYTGEALVLIRPEHSSELATNASVEAAIQGGPEAVPTEVIVLQSRSLAIATIQRLRLDHDPEFVPPLHKDAAAANAATTKPMNSKKPASEDVVSTAVVDAFLARLHVDEEPRTNVIRVSFTSSRPALAALVPNTLIEIYIDRLIESKKKAAMQEIKRLEDIVLPLLRQKMPYSEVDRRLYEHYLELYETARIDLGRGEWPDATFASRAAVPLAPSFPKTKLMVMAGATLGGGAGIVLVLILDAWIGGLRSTREVETTLGVRCLGAIPLVRRDHVQCSAQKARDSAFGHAVAGIRRYILRYIEAIPMLRRGRKEAFQRPPLPARDTAFGRAVRSIQLKLRSSDLHGGPWVILVTSAMPGEGKSWTAVGLAASLAADGSSVILVDCDSYRPAVHRMLENGGEPGLTDYLSGGALFDQIIHRNPASGVDYIPAGTAASQVARRITPDNLQPLIARLAEKYSFIIMDSSPVLAVSETMLLGQIAGRTLMVVKWNSTRAEIVRQALRQLEEAGAEIVALLSMVDVKRAALYGDPVAGAYRRLEGHYGRYPRA